MSRGIKVRLIVFAILTALGVLYVAGNYLGVVDRMLGRSYVVHAELPGSGGLYVGSAVTYRGFQVGEVLAVEPAAKGIVADLRIDDDARIPADADVRVRNLTAVGEQYLDFAPRDEKGPFVREGHTFQVGPEGLPLDEGELLVQLEAFVSTVDTDALRTTVRELDAAFTGTGRPLQELIDSGTRFLDEAMAHQDDTSRLLRSGLTVLRTQQEQGDNIVALARDLRLLTDSLRRADPDLETLLKRSPKALRQVDRLVDDLGATMPAFLANLITVEEVVVGYLPGIEQLLVTYPRVISTGPSGTQADGWGRISLQYDNSVGPCREGYLPPSQWRPPDDLRFADIPDVRCASGEPYNMRGGNYAPRAQPLPRPKAWRGSYDRATGRVYAQDGTALGRMSTPGDLGIFGEDSWKWLVMSPVTDP